MEKTKTEKRTAEEIVNKNDTNEGWPRWVTKKSAIESCEEYAAQELAAYKTRLKNYLSYEHESMHIGWQEMIELIDKS